MKIYLNIFKAKKEQHIAQEEEVMKYKSSSAKEKGPIGIQLHGSRNMKIDFKDILVKDL